MESRQKKRLRNLKKWGVYGLLLILAVVLQAMPGFLTIGEAKPLFVLPLCLAVALQESTLEGALYGAVGGLLWDFCAGRTAGLLALEVMCICLLVSLSTEVWLQNSIYNYVLLCAVAVLFAVGSDFLFYYVMRGYPGKTRRLLSVVLPACVFTLAVSPVWHAAAQAVHRRFSLP